MNKNQKIIDLLGEVWYVIRSNFVAKTCCRREENSYGHIDALTEIIEGFEERSRV